MIDLSFLTDAEQEAILKVLHRDAELKKAEEHRVRELQDKVDDENELKYKSGQWFYEAKSKRHRDKIHGADLVRASIRKRKSPTTLELYGIMEPPDETEEDIKASKGENNQSAKKVNITSSETDKKVIKNGTASPIKQRKNPFNSEGSVGEIDLELSSKNPEAGQVNGDVGKKSDLMSSIKKYGVKLPYPSPVGGRRTSQGAEDDPLPKQPPVPKPRKFAINGQPPDHSSPSLQRENSFNSANKPKGILKRRSSSSSTDSESFRIPQNGEPIKLVLPTSPILEAEQNYFFNEQDGTLESFPDRQKQVRFSENVLQKPPTPNPESYTPREIGEFGILDPNYHPNEFDYGFVDEESEPTQYSYSAEPRSQNSLDENPNVALTIQTPSNLTPNLDVKKKLEDPSKEISRKGISEILDESYPEINVDSAGTEPLYAIVKKPSQSTSSDQEKDLALDDALMEPRFLGQRGKTESTYQSGQPLEFGKSFGGVGKVNYASNSPTSQHGKVYVSNNEEILDPERATDVQSSYDFVEEPKPSIQDSDYVPKWRRPFSLENQSDLLLQQRPVLEFTEGNRSKYSPEEIDTKYKSTFLHDTPDGREVTQSCNFPAAQSTPLSSKPESGNFQAQELFLRENRERKELPKSANFKVMSMKERIHDTPKEQMSNPSQFQSLKHFWNVEDKNRTKGDADTSPQRILTDVLMRNKPTRADLKQRNSKEIPADDLSLPSSFDSLSEEEQTSHKVASWLAQTPTVYGDEQVDANVDQVHPGKEVMENIEKTVVDRKNQAADFSIAIQKRTEEALQAPKITDNKPLKTETIQISPIVPSSLLEKKEKSPENLVNSAEKNRVSTGFYQRVVQISSSQSPAKQETKIVVDKPAIGTKQSPAKEVEESVERTVAPERTSNEFKIGFQKLMEEYESTKSDNENQVKESRPPTKEQQLIETHEFIDKSSVPKGNDHQEFISALKKLEIEASTPLILEDQDEQTVSISPPNQLSPVKSEYKIGFEHMMPVEDEEILEAPQKHNVTYTVQSSSSYYKDRKKIEEVVEKTTGPSRKDDGAARKKLDVTYTIKSSPPYYKEDEIDEVVGRTTVPRRKDESDLGTALKKLEQEAAINDPDLELEETYKKMTPTLQSAKNFSPVQDYESPNFNVQKEPSTAYHLENKSDLEDPNVNKTGKSVKKPEDTYGIKAIPEIEKPIFTSDGHGKLPVEEIIEKTIIDTEQSSADYRNRLMRLEEESANLAPEEPEDLTVGKSVEDPKDTYGIKTIPVIENPIYTSEGHGKLPVEEIIEKTIVDTEQSSADYRNRLMRLEEESANLAPEEPEDLTVGKSVEDPKDTYGIKTIPVIEKPIYTSEGHGKLPVEEIIEKTIVDTEQSSADYRNRLMRLEEESANLAPEEPEDLTVGKSVEDPKDTYGIKTIPVIEKPIYTSEGHGKLPVEEIIEKTIVDTEQSSADYRNRLMRLEEESANLAPEEPEDVTVGETFNVSQAPTKEVFISKRVFSSNESMPTELPSSGAIPKDLSQPQPYAYQELANNPQSPSNQSGSFSGSAGNVLYKKPETSSQVSNSKQGLLEKPKSSPQKLIHHPDNMESSGPHSDFIQGNEAAQMPIPEMAEISEPKDDMNVNSDQPEILNTTPIEDESLPLQQVPVTEFLEFGKSGSGCGKSQSRTIHEDSLQEGPVGKDDESLEVESPENSVLKEKMVSLGIGDTGAPVVSNKTDHNDVLALEQNKEQSSKKAEKDESAVPQKRVSDIKLLWEGERPSQEVTKKPALGNIKHGSVELSITPKSSSFDSDDHSTSLVTFKKVMVEDEVDSMPPVNQLKSFWENEKNKDTTKDRPGKQSVMNGSHSDDKGAPMVDPRSKFKKRHTFHDFFEKEKSNLEKNPPGRSVSLSESANESLKDRVKSASFQNLKNFWSTSSKSDDKRTNKVMAENMTKQFGSNPDIRGKETFGWRVKSTLAAKSLQDIREDPSTVSEFQVYDAKPMSRKFSRGYSKPEDTQISVNKTKKELKPSNVSGENGELGKPMSSVNLVVQESSAPSNYPDSSSPPSGQRESKQGPNELPHTEVMEESVAPKRVAKSEISLRLKSLQDEEPGKKMNLPEERSQSMTSKSFPDDQNVYRDRENGEVNEKGRKIILVKQSGFDSGSPVISNVSGSLQSISDNGYPTGKELSDSREVVHENVEKTVLKKHPSDFDSKLQNLYNESLNMVDTPKRNVSELEYMSINEPEQNFTKVLAVSSANKGKNIQSSEANTGHQPIIINISSKKMFSNEDIVNCPTDTAVPEQTHSIDVHTVPGHLGQDDLRSSEVTNITSQETTSKLKVSSSKEPEVNELSSDPNDYKNNALQPEELPKKEIVERIEMPIVLPKNRNFFDEKLKKLYEESQNSQPTLEESADSDNYNEQVGVKDKTNVYLHLSKPKKTFLTSSTVNLESSQTISADRKTVTDESAPSSSSSQAPDMSVQEVHETIEKTVAPKRISTAKSLEELQKEALNEEEGGFVGNVFSGHVALNESHAKLSDPALRKNSLSETFPRENENAVLGGTEPARFEEHQEGTPETSVDFISNRQSTPVKDRESSLRRSTLELYLEAPYRREISKSIDFDSFGYVTSDVDKCMDESHPILSALKRSADKKTSKAVLEVSPTSTNQSKLNSEQEDTVGPIENSFPENAEKFKRMSQSVPTFLQDETDGRETDSASESSFQIGRHKKSPSSLTNLSGSSGMASMSSVSGSVMSIYSGDFGNMDIKGAIEFSIDYAEQLNEFHIYIYQCKDLAAAEVKKQRSDPYVKSYLLPEKAKMGKRKTAVKKKTLNPVYNEILRYKIQKQSLQAQTLNLSVWHHDALGRNSFLGEVNLNLATWDWNNTQRNWYQLEPRTPASGIGLENRGEIKLALKYIPVSPPEVGKKTNTTGEVHIWIKECIQLPKLRENKINSFVKCTILPDTSRKSRQRTRAVDKTPNPIFNHTMVYDGFKEEDLREACVELTVWDHNKLSNHFLGGLRIGLGTGKSYGTAVDWMDSSHEEAIIWEKMMASPNTWIEGMLPLRMFKMAKLSK
ncbi:synaptotagmin-like protein 2 isoform X2 [Dendropsophus ebraccatus]|uniref:synaptotagmin-like protein 2 isoform X2 n=1 Tax=Dendropsophus ebraccatus TaxID=150705 RepID=UPI003831F32D